MVDVITTQLLEQLLDAAEHIEAQSDYTLTAERFLVAAIDMANSINEDADVEALELKEKLAFLVGDFETAREKLMAYIRDTKKKVFLDHGYMLRRIQLAADSCRQNNEEALGAVALLECIAEEPSEIIQVVFTQEAKQTAAPKPITPRMTAEMKAKIDALYSKRFGPGKRPQTTAEEEKDSVKETQSMDRQIVTPQEAKDEMGALVAEVRELRTHLQSKVLGQDHAINVFLAGYFKASMLAMMDKKRNSPRATFLFAGPPGVGKTFLAESVAEVLGLPHARFDMSEYADKEANIEFCGSDQVYKNGKPGNVTEFVSKNPKCVILFDEIEKAHLCVIHLFLQMLDAGRLRDNFTDKEVSFQDAIIILTTNAGKQLYDQSENEDLSGISRKVIINSLRDDINPITEAPFFPAAICSRFASGNVVMFNHLAAHHLRMIAKNEIQSHGRRLEEKTGIKMDIDEAVYTSLLFSEGSAADARTIRSRAESFFNDELYELLRLISSDHVTSDISDLEQIQIEVDLEGANADIIELFTPSEHMNVLVFAGDQTVTLCKEKVPGIEFLGTQCVNDAIEAIKNQKIDFVLIDVKQGISAETTHSLNIEDVASPARDFFKFLREQRREIPIYLIEMPETELSEEEKASFARQGVRDTLRITKGEDDFVQQLQAVAMSMHQQESMVVLAKGNRLVTFETAQTVSSNGKNAQIKLFDFGMTVAVDSEDQKNILSAVSRPNVHFEDVIGAQDAKRELEYFVKYLKNPKKYMGTGVKAPRGVILYGPPGTGKTMLAKAMACEAGLTFIAAEGNQFLTKYVGEGSEKVHELFRTARKYAPSILFVDEIDAIAKERKGGEYSSSNGEATLTAFLTEMDGFSSDPSKPVFVLAATNFDVEPGSDKSLDPALMRRFDRRVYIDLPNREDRVRFLKLQIERNPALVLSDAQIDSIAMRSTGMSLAQLDSVVELALRSAIREESTTVNDAIFEDAFETFNSGDVKKWDVSQLERVARHEAGHAVLCWLSGETPSYLTIVARGNHGGYMQHADQEGKAIYTRDELFDRIRTSLGGRAAEILYYGDRDGISTGASGDLASATSVARQILCTYGMDDEFGLAVVNAAAAENGTMTPEVRTAVNRILQEQMNEAISLLRENKARIDALVAALLDKNHLNEEEIEQVLRMNTDTTVS